MVVVFLHLKFIIGVLSVFGTFEFVVLSLHFKPLKPVQKSRFLFSFLRFGCWARMPEVKPEKVISFSSEDKVAFASACVFG